MPVITRINERKEVAERRHAGWVHGFYGLPRDPVLDGDKDYSDGYAHGQRNRADHLSTCGSAAPREAA